MVSGGITLGATCSKNWANVAGKNPLVVVFGTRTGNGPAYIGNALLTNYSMGTDQSVMAINGTAGILAGAANGAETEALKG